MILVAKPRRLFTSGSKPLNYSLGRINGRVSSRAVLRVEFCIVEEETRFFRWLVWFLVQYDTKPSTRWRTKTEHYWLKYRTRMQSRRQKTFKKHFKSFEKADRYENSWFWTWWRIVSGKSSSSISVVVIINIFIDSTVALNYRVHSRTRSTIILVEYYNTVSGRQIQAENL